MSEPERNDSVDPEEFLRRMLAISSEDAADVRQDAAKRRSEEPVEDQRDER